VKLLVLGAAGQLGHDMVLAARAAGVPVTGLTRAELDVANSDGLGDRLGDGLADRLDRHPFDVLVNCAAYTAVDAAESDGDAAFALNAAAPERLAAVCQARGARLVQPSTDFVFDGVTARPYREDHPPAPISVYGASKLTGEARARRAWREGTLVVRTASLFGVQGARRADAGRGGNFVEAMIRRGGETGRLRVVDDVVMSPTFTADLAAGILGLLEADAPAGIYHLVNAGRASWYDFARAIIGRAGVSARVAPVPASAYPTPARRPAFSVLDTGKAAAAGVVMRPWEEALGSYLSARAG
jgi:dTDP-4-dehydrorhamnose reductase